MNILTLDFETFFDDDYTLKKLTTEHYIRDARFEALGCGVRLADGSTDWWPAEDISAQFEIVDWNNTAVLMHHAHFDGLILSHHYGIKPRFIYDTLSMARLMLGNHVSVGLESLARHFGLSEKSVPYNKFRGKRAADIDPVLMYELGAGCLHDVELTWQIFCKLLRGERS